MQEYIDFALKNAFLSATWLVLFVTWVMLTIYQRVMGARFMNRQEATLLVNHYKGIFVDVRSPLDFTQGHIAGAHHLSLKLILSDHLEKLKPYQTRPVVLVSQTSHQARKAARVLLKKGFEQVYVLEGGMSGWLSERLPVKRL